MDHPNTASQRLSRRFKKSKELLNQIFEIEKKAARLEEDNSLERNLRSIKDLFRDGFFREISLEYENPLGEEYDDTKAAYDAEIAGESAENLVITEVVKPVIRFQKKDGRNLIVQRGLVIVQSKDEIANEQED